MSTCQLLRKQVKCYRHHSCHFTFKIESMPLTLVVTPHFRFAGKRRPASDTSELRWFGDLRHLLRNNEEYTTKNVTHLVIKLFDTVHVTSNFLFCYLCRFLFPIWGPCHADGVDDPNLCPFLCLPCTSLFP